MTYYSIKRPVSEGIVEFETDRLVTDGKASRPLGGYGNEWLKIGRDCFETRAEAERAAVKKLDGMIADAERRAEKLRKLRVAIMDDATEREMREAR